MPSWPAIWGFSSRLILISRIAPAFSLTTFSSAGVSCRQGPHQGAQKSTSTGCSSDASMTSPLKAWSVESLISTAALAGVGAEAATPLNGVDMTEKGPFERGGLGYLRTFLRPQTVM